MKCVMCKGGELAPGKTTVKVQREREREYEAEREGMEM